ncbi:MAG: SDR family oxidoreductase [Phycisphaerae bacterium]|jgi:NADP-dependent 3-hydroxy acid dehydrogenase YdfG|nr:SDR family oxidoreductase [Phycisphaerae bacterium]
MNCKDKIVIITGGSKGYGLGMAEVLASHGAKVTITGRHLESLKAAADKLGVGYVQADVGSGDDWDKILAVTGNKVDVLINNAGAGVKIAPVAQQDDMDIIESIQTNLIGAILGCRRVAKIMTAQKYGLIINISSVCAHYGWPGWSVYTAAKAGLNKFSRAFYTEMRPYNVRVTVLTPSWGNTGFASAAKLSPSCPDVVDHMMTPAQMGELVLQVCEAPEHLVFPEIMVQPLVQEIVPF